MAQGKRKFGNNISGQKYALLRSALEQKSLDEIEEIRKKMKDGSNVPVEATDRKASVASRGSAEVDQSIINIRKGGFKKKRTRYSTSHVK